MKQPFAAPRTIRRIAVRRRFQMPRGKDVVLTIGVPQPVPGSDWGCAIHITGLRWAWSRPRFVFGIDGLQALHLAMKCATAMLESWQDKLEWLGKKGDLGLPRFLPDLPKAQQNRIDALVEREVARLRAVAARRSQARTFKKARTQA